MASKERARILIVEDNQETLYGLRNNFEIEGYCVATAKTLSEAQREILNHRPDLIVLDLMLPDGDGVELIPFATDRGVDCAVIILTARVDEKDKIMGLRLGADDYMSKPFGILELLARVEKRLEQRALNRHWPNLPRLQLGDIELDLIGQVAVKSDRRIRLTRQEVRLLGVLLKWRGEPVRREVLLREVWALPSDARTRALDMCVTELRRKLELDPTKPVNLVTVRNVGYMIRD